MKEQYKEVPNHSNGEKNGKNGNESKIKRIFQSQIIYLIVIISAIFGAYGLLTKPIVNTQQDVAVLKKDMAVIKEKVNEINHNDLTHIEDNIDEIQKCNENQNEQLIRMETKLNSIYKKINQ